MKQKCKAKNCKRTAIYDADFCYRHMYNHKDQAYKEKVANRKGGFYNGRRKNK